RPEPSAPSHAANQTQPNATGTSSGTATVSPAPAICPDLTTIMLTLIVFTTTEMQDLTGIQQRSETTQRMRMPGRPHQHVFVNDAAPTNVPSSNHPPHNVHPSSPDQAR